MFTCTAKAHPRKKRPSPPTSQINSRSTSLRLNWAISLETGILPFPAVFLKLISATNASSLSRDAGTTYADRKNASPAAYVPSFQAYSNARNNAYTTSSFHRKDTAPAGNAHTPPMRCNPHTNNHFLPYAGNTNGPLSPQPSFLYLSWKLSYTNRI